MEAILGRKLGMTQVFSANGEARGVTVVEAGPCVVVQIKTQDNDGYEAIQIGFGTRKRVNKPLAGHMKRLGQFRFLREIRVDDSNAYEIGQKLGPELFEEGDIVDVVGKSKGKGFAGGVKRYHFSRWPQDARSVGQAPLARFDWLGHHARPCPQGPAHGRPHGRRPRDGEEPAHIREQRRSRRPADRRSPYPAPRTAWYASPRRARRVK